MDRKRTIDEILSLKTGEKINVDNLLEFTENDQSKIFQLRQKLEIQLQKKEIEYVCIYCKQAVVLRGRKNFNNPDHYYFSHPYKSSDCIIKNRNMLSEEQIRCIKYNGEKESERHYYLKNRIAYFLKKNKDVNSVKVEPVIKHQEISRKWRKPDVLALFENKTVAIELQLSTTFLSVIVGRTIFYNEKGIFLLWIFPNFSLNDHLQKFTQKDIFYNNNSNVYVFDAEAERQSELEDDLIIKCYFKKYHLVSDQVQYSWEIKLIFLSDIIFDAKTHQYWFHNSEEEKNSLTKVLKNREQEKIKKENAIKCEQKAKKAVSFIREYLKNDKYPSSYYYDPVKSLVTFDEIQILDQKLKFTGQNEIYIINLFQKFQKKNFLKYILESKAIKINKTSIFETIFNLDDEYLFDDYCFILFKNDFQLNDSQMTFLKNWEADDLYERRRRSSVGFIYSKLKLETDFENSRKNLKILHAIHSLKLCKVVGFRYDNLKGINNYIFEQRPEFSSLYISYLKKYNLYDVFFTDNSKTFKTKIEQFQLTNPIQNIGLDIISKIVFE